jgi:hypothetical protein
VERMYSSYSFLTSALDGVSGQRHALSSFYPQGKYTRYSFVQETEWAPKLVWTQRLEEKSFCLCLESHSNRSAVQSIARYYTD